MYLLKGRMGERETEKDLPFAGTLLKIPATVATKSSQSQEHGILSESSPGVAGTHVLGPPSAAFPFVLAGC